MFNRVYIGVFGEAVKFDKIMCISPTWSDRIHDNKESIFCCSLDYIYVEDQSHTALSE